MSRRFAFETAWGSCIEADGSARFRLWAGGLTELGLRLERVGDIPMRRREDGWFEHVRSGIAPGTAYSFVLPDGRSVPDPAARAQAGDVHGPSLLVDPRSYRWRTADWRGRAWQEAVIYELHVGTFSRSGTFDGVIERLDELAGLGITAIELMPVAQFAGSRGWGYDGVLLYCPHNAYGGAEGLKRLVDAAHARRLMVLLDVVYNHFGPDGNYIHAYTPEFFDPDRHTPWGAGIRFETAPVRAFFLDNPLYWLEEYRLDGLRFDAIDQVADPSPEPILEEMARRVRERFPDRHVHLTTEDERNIVHLHQRDGDGRPTLFTAEWNDDVHHAAHVLATGEDQGYYQDFADDPVRHLLRALTEGFAFQGEPYGHWQGRQRGVASAGQPPLAFVDFLQNHDQVGNRACGERLSTLCDPEILECLLMVLLLNPQVPLLFMGDEYGETRPFLFFADFTGELATAVREGRRREFAAFAAFADETARERIPDPCVPETFARSRLDPAAAETEAGARRKALIRGLLDLRHRHVVPRLAGMRAMSGSGRQLGQRAFDARWTLGDGTSLWLAANFGNDAVAIDAGDEPADMLHESREGGYAACRAGTLPPRTVVAAQRR